MTTLLGGNPDPSVSAPSSAALSSRQRLSGRARGVEYAAALGWLVVYDANVKDALPEDKTFEVPVDDKQYTVELGKEKTVRKLEIYKTAHLFLGVSRCVLTLAPPYLQEMLAWLAFADGWQRLALLLHNSC